ncbi:hypothetical protein BDW74DRAFT_122535 [Aspergillus multicolor]|uniref:uncharacterized protein n=1 Tax=Aspergillus multicolor TaxID=41759 RepID=UPI003CCD1015
MKLLWMGRLMLSLVPSLMHLDGIWRLYSINSRNCNYLFGKWPIIFDLWPLTGAGWATQTGKSCTILGASTEASVYIQRSI